MKKINKLLICIGAQKAGTSWLHDVLKEDSRLKMPIFVKEVHYFDYRHAGLPLIERWREAWLKHLSGRPQFNEALLEYQKYGHKLRGVQIKNKMLYRKIAFCLRPLNDDWYCDYMKVPSDKEWAVDITPDYAVIDKNGFEHMRHVAEELRLLFILRDPIERSWSGMIQELKNKPDAAEKLKNMGGADVSALVGRTKKPNIYKRSDYLTTFKSMEAANILNSLKVVFYDDILNKPDSVLNDVYAHIGMVKPIVENPVISQVVHKSPPIAMPAEFSKQMRDAYAPMLAEINRRFVSLPDSWKQRYGI